MNGLAEMAARLAESRRAWEIDKHPIHNVYGHISVVSRDQIDEFLTPASCEYYRIIDRIARGEKP
jgi:hypothetical protein